MKLECLCACVCSFLPPFPRRISKRTKANLVRMRIIYTPEWFVCYYIDVTTIRMLLISLLLLLYPSLSSVHLLKSLLRDNKPILAIRDRTFVLGGLSHLLSMRAAVSTMFYRICCNHIDGWIMRGLIIDRGNNFWPVMWSTGRWSFGIKYSFTFLSLIPSASGRDFPSWERKTNKMKVWLMKPPSPLDSHLLINLMLGLFRAYNKPSAWHDYIMKEEEFGLELNVVQATWCLID